MWSSNAPRICIPRRRYGGIASQIGYERESMYAVQSNSGNPFRKRLLLLSEARSEQNGYLAPSSYQQRGLFCFIFLVGFIRNLSVMNFQSTLAATCPRALRSGVPKRKFHRITSPKEAMAISRLANIQSTYNGPELLKSIKKQSLQYKTSRHQTLKTSRSSLHGNDRLRLRRIVWRLRNRQSAGSLALSKRVSRSSA